jgi:hydrogenase maturation factor
MTLRPGKLPQPLLAELLSRISHRDPRVIVGPAIGRDAAVVDLGDRLLVAKTDPVTFATRRIGAYAVHVNANDIACMGARPSWFMAAALLPPGEPETIAAEIIDDLDVTCSALGIELIAGHTEVTAGLDRPMIAGAMLGVASRDEIITGENVRAGDAVLMTKRIAIEGTALLAHDAAGTLAARGVDAMTSAAARSLLDAPGISVVRDAQVICAATRPRILHDPTEGGVATALQELAYAAGKRLRVEPARIRIDDCTQTICDALRLDPLGLLASGALLAIVDATSTDRVCDGLLAEGINCAIIGYVEDGAPAVIMGAEDQATPLPVFARDEIARFYDELQHAEGL